MANISAQRRLPHAPVPESGAAPAALPVPTPVATPTAALAPASSGLLARTVDWVLRLSMAGIVLVVLAQIAGRLSDRPFPWTEELTRALFIWMMFIGMAASMRRADAARVTVLLQWLSRPLRRLAVPVYMVACLGFFGLMAWTGLGMVRQQWMMNETIATLGWPNWVIGAVIPLAGLLAIVCTLASLRDCRALIAAEEERAP